MKLKDIQLLLYQFFQSVEEHHRLVLLNKKKELCILRYQQLNTFHISESAIKNKSFSAKEAALLKFRLFTCFKEFITLLKAQCPSLTEDELYLCICLTLRLSKNIVLILMGTNANALKTRRCRLRQKMPPKVYNKLKS